MNKTKVDDMLVEMIEPKIKEIEKKFGSQQVLTQEDINTLLLKSQFNHINHLDVKLDEVTEDVSSLKGDFNELKGDFKDLKVEFKELKVDLYHKFDNLDRDVNTKLDNLDRDLNSKLDNLDKDLNTKFSNLDRDLNGKFDKLEVSLKKDNEIFKEQMNSKFDKMEINIQKTINSNMKWTYGLIGFIVVGMKALDIFVK